MKMGNYTEYRKKRVRIMALKELNHSCLSAKVEPCTKCRVAGDFPCFEH